MFENISGKDPRRNPRPSQPSTEPFRATPAIANPEGQMFIDEAAEFTEDNLAQAADLARTTPPGLVETFFQRYDRERREQTESIRRCSKVICTAMHTVHGIRIVEIVYDGFENSVYIDAENTKFKDAEGNEIHPNIDLHEPMMNTLYDLVHSLLPNGWDITEINEGLEGVARIDCRALTCTLGNRMAGQSVVTEISEYNL